MDNVQDKEKSFIARSDVEEKEGGMNGRLLGQCARPEQ